MKTILNNWVAKLLSLVLAVILWSVIRKSLETTGSPSRFQWQTEQSSPAGGKVEFSGKGYGNPAKK